MDYLIKPIGHVQGGRAEPIDDDWGGSRSVIALDPEQFGPEALAGLDGFSHAEIIFVFDKVAPDTIERTGR